VADIREALVKMRDEQYVPDYIEDYTTPQACVAAYQNAIDWIDVHGHAYISNGPFFIDIFDPANQHMVEKAFRDANYPFEAWFWNDVLQTRVLSIREVVVPVLAEAGGDDFSFLIKVDQAIYPDNNWKPATEATVTLRLEGSTEIRYKASLYKPGYFDGEILGRDTAGLPDGHYPLVATAQWSGALPSALLTFLVIQTPP
jgi:peptide/nickel transport system substrate-binding protein